MSQTSNVVVEGQLVNYYNVIEFNIFKKPGVSLYVVKDAAL
jgi:hypothetical protein